MWNLRSRSRDERGAVMIMFAIMIVMLFGFMALAVDAAHAFVQRRNSQNKGDIKRTLPKGTIWAWFLCDLNKI